MKNLTSHKVRSMFLLGGVAAMMGATLIVPQTANADTAQNYKAGATALGILGAVLAVKGKTLPAIIAGAGAYYAYEKGKDAENDDRYDSRYNDYNWNDNRYDRNDYRYRSNDYYGGRYDNDRNDNRDCYDNRDDSNNYYRNRYDNNNYDRYDRNYNR
jgi:hypothetical protein